VYFNNIYTFFTQLSGKLNAGHFREDFLFTFSVFYEVVRFLMKELWTLLKERREFKISYFSFNLS
jgi:hypothetical protein